MGDYLLQLSDNGLARRSLKALGMPTPRTLARSEAPYEDRPLAGQRLVLAGEGGFNATLQRVLADCGAELAGAGADGQPASAVVFDASAVARAADLRALYSFFHDNLQRLAADGRVVVVTATPSSAADSVQAACRRGIEGFTRSLAKELGRRGATANLIYAETGAGDRLEGPLRFLLSRHATYVDGQPITVRERGPAPAEMPRTQPLTGKTALVTGAAQGIGAATAACLAREGATVVCLDIPAAEQPLKETAARVGGRALTLDVTGEDAPARIAGALDDGVDVVVHNAGITRDKTLARMPEHYWDQLMAINLEAILRIDGKLEADGVLRDQGRVVCLSSIGGIAGNAGQTNYATAKAALIGYVDAQAQRLAPRGITVNAVAPGFIETRMTAAMPFMIREAGRRMNSLSQGGQPGDVAEAITFLATPGACGISGMTLRVCGQSLIGA
ncbi:3-oxoacyl-ACP reductase [Ectothiorhodospiraceae bacterium WFHF3C12]|nr:3-oxoacyl-ACP reductase [Ectothiorhodospiraceae bacterium WFHF3C12]